MEARLRSRYVWAWLLIAVFAVQDLRGASSRSTNFIVQAPTPALAAEIAQTAEQLRRQLAEEWLGQALPDWPQPCPIRADVKEKLGAGGRTSFMFNGRTPFGWEMEVQGSRERVLDSVLPHEVTHTIFATHFGRPLPRWADEGACTTVEHWSERQKQELWLGQFLRTERGIPFNQMFAMMEYPGDMLPLYSQGYSVARYLLHQGGKRKFVAFVGQGMDTNNWPAAVQQHYGFASLGDLQLDWVDWVAAGSRVESIAERDAEQVSQTRTVSDTSAEAERQLAPQVAARGRRPVIDPQLVEEANGPTTVALASTAASAPADRNWYVRRESTEGRPDDLSAAAEVSLSPRRSNSPVANGWQSRGATEPGVVRSLSRQSRLVNQNLVR